ncbi:MAG TPA: FecR family protein, partial [Anaerolineales bacterium]|nr:FecR family protein [Anaerolineales bacterium]
MSDNEEKLQKKLEDLEAGKPLEESMEGLEDNEVELLKLASTLRGFDTPARNPAIVEEQIRKIRQTAVKDSTQDKGTTMKSIFQRSTWFTPAMATVMLVLIGCLIVAGFGLGGLTLVRLGQSGNDPARVQNIQGILEYQTQDGSWQLVKDNARLVPGTRLRTRELSSAQLSLQDGSVVHIGASTEITLDQMVRFLLGKRLVRITQWQGETGHDVQANRKKDSLYEVRTPTATITAKGTSFDVDVSTDLLTRVSVTEGVVDLTGGQNTISLEPGQTSSVAVDESPSVANLLVKGEGFLTISENN